jgi:DNA-binding response OmpR family regulator
MNGKDRILVMDDDTELLKLLQQFFVNHPFVDIVTCSSVPACHDCFRPNEYAMILVDLKFGTDSSAGFDLITMIRAMDETVVVAIITGNPELLKDQRLIELGVDDVFVKPLELEKLVYRILLNLARAKRWRAIQHRIGDFEVSYQQEMEQVRRTMADILKLQAP